jgi:hypothetical protein
MFFLSINLLFFNKFIINICNTIAMNPRFFPCSKQRGGSKGTLGSFPCKQRGGSKGTLGSFPG